MSASGLILTEHLFVGGDLTYFIVERNARESLSYVDILSCGNGRWGV